MAKKQLGYWLVKAGSKGFGVVYSDGSPAAKLGSSAKATFLGTTEAAIKANLLKAGAKLGLPVTGELDVNATANTAVHHKVAWYGPRYAPNGAVATPDLLYLAAGAGAAGELAPALRAIVSGASAESNIGGSGDISTTEPKAGDTTSSGDSNSTDNNPPGRDITPTKSELTAKGLNLGALTLSGPDLVRILEVVGGVILMIMAAREFSGKSGTSVVVRTAKAGAKAAGAALA